MNASHPSDSFEDRLDATTDEFLRRLIHDVRDHAFVIDGLASLSKDGNIPANTFTIILEKTAKIFAELELAEAYLARLNDD